MSPSSSSVYMNPFFSVKLMFKISLLGYAEDCQVSSLRTMQVKKEDKKAKIITTKPETLQHHSYPTLCQGWALTLFHSHSCWWYVTKLWIAQSLESGTSNQAFIYSIHWSICHLPLFSGSTQATPRSSRLVLPLFFPSWNIFTLCLFPLVQDVCAFHRELIR